MATSLTVPKILNYPPGMNYQLLRREGMRHLERLGSAIWTDFNSHDPGVTMLEVLCYALTDLGYRAQLPEADLFAPLGNRKAFFTAAEIMPNAPVTALDFRKILIDIEGVKNAWIEEEEEGAVLFQLDLKNNAAVDVLKKERLKEYVNAFATGTPKIELKFADDAADLLAEIQKVRHKKPLNKKQLEEAIKKFDNSCCIDVTTSAVIDAERPYSKAVMLYLIETHFEKIEHWLKMKIGTQPKGILEQLKNLKDELAIYWVTKTRGKIIKEFLKPANSALPKQLFEPFVCPFLTGYLLENSLKIEKIPEKKEDIKYRIFSPKGIYKVYLQLEEGYETQANRIRQVTFETLHKNRALCEDFGNIKIVDKAPVCVHTAIELTPEADPKQVYAELIFAIENFLAPGVSMYSLLEMLDKYGAFALTDRTLADLAEADLPTEILQSLEPLRGKSWIGKQAWQKELTSLVGQTAWDDYAGLLYTHTQRVYEAHPIFQGPLLQHGFIDDTELEAASWRRVVYKSDLFQVLSKTENVVRVTKLVLKKASEDDKTVEKDWCLSFDCDCQPTLDLDCSKFVFTSNNRPITLDESDWYEVQDRLEQLRGQNAKINQKGGMDLPVPRGVQRDDLAEYTSIQEEFPRTYHVGREGISTTETPLRQAQAKQMKGFLLFFDQILANYLAHLAQVRDVLAIESPNEKGILYQTLYEVPNVQPLLTAFDPNTDWKTFVENTDNEYVKALDKLTNGSDITQKLRQNQLIDHLLARFGEQFTDHALNLFQIERPLDETTPETDVTDWVADKRLLLSKIPQLGSERGRGLNYRVEPLENNGHFLDSDNESGFKSRVLAQLGVDNWQRRVITCSPKFFTDIKIEMVNKAKRYRFGIKKEENEQGFLLLSTALYSRESPANDAAELFYAQASAISQYEIIQNNKQYFVGFWHDETTAPRTEKNAMLISGPLQETEANKRLQEIKYHINQQCQIQNFHVVEHILLRPADTNYKLLKSAPHSSDLRQLDPYSFWVSVFVPAWVTLFDDPNQYGQFEQLVRSEMPAHVAIHFVKLNEREMRHFEQAYFEWLKVKTDLMSEAFDLRTATNQLIDFMNNPTMP